MNKKIILIMCVFFINSLTLFASSTVGPTFEPIDNSGSYDDCSSLVGEGTLEILSTVFIIIKVAVPIMLIIYTMMDFTKAISASDSEMVSKAFNNFVKRAVAACFVFFVPDIVNFILNVTNITTSCGLY